MALKMRKDIKKSLYYVWFLGAKESKGLRGSEYIIPVIKHLEQREKEIEPFKVTLQVSHKGLKIIQNVVAQGKSKPKNETIKHFIPHNTITCVYQQDDIIACILLLFNPVTKCPLHIHAYRCDSVETAGLLKQQLQILIESPENQKKFAEIEGRLHPPPKEKKLESSLGSDTGTSTRESESSEERYHENNRIATLYDSVAAELRAKLKKNDEPILLPPRDYDTVHRQKGNLTGIELRRCLNTNIVGQNVKAKRIESSGGSSGIGSDHPPSPDSPNSPDSRFNTLDNHSTSDEEWNANNNDSTSYLMHSASSHLTLPRPSRNTEVPEENHAEYRDYKYQNESKRYNHQNDKLIENDITKYLEKPIAKFTDNKYLERQKSLERERQMKKSTTTTTTTDRTMMNGHKSLEKQDSRSKSYDYDAPKYYYNEFEKNGDNNNCKYPEKRYYDDDQRIDKERSGKYFEDDGFDEAIRYRNSNNKNQKYSSYCEQIDEPSRFHQSLPIPKIRQKYIEEYSDNKKHFDEYEHHHEPQRGTRTMMNKEVINEFKRGDLKIKKNHEQERPEVVVRSRTKKLMNDYNDNDEFRKERKYFGDDDIQAKPRPKSVNEKYQYEDDEVFEDITNRRKPQFRQRTPSPEGVINVSPQDRFRDAKEKFLSMERERQANQRWMNREEINNSKAVPYLKRHESMMNSSKERYEDYYETSKPEVRYRREPPVERYKNDKSEPKRRSMFNLNEMDEREHRKNSNDICKELKRRSYLVDEEMYKQEMLMRERERNYHELPESERYPTIERDLERNDMKYDGKFVKNQKKIGAGYRHSYAEPKLRMMDKKNGMNGYDNMLHRTNSSVGNNLNGRVGIASVHPY